LEQNYGKDWKTPISGKDWDWAFSPKHIIIEPYKTIEDFKKNFYEKPEIPDSIEQDELKIMRYLKSKIKNKNSYYNYKSF